jgi:hypothetical protein
VKPVTTTLKHHDNPIVDIAEGVFFPTAIPSANLPALRSGFAGYPANPRWNAVKFHAWKTGRQLREAYGCGEMVVRSSDSMLVAAHNQECATESAPKSNLPGSRLFLNLWFVPRQAELT